MDDTITDTDLFDPVYQFAEYRLLWFLWVAYDGEFPMQVKVDAITGEALAIRSWGMSGPVDGGRGGELAALVCPGHERTTLW
jgi:hypothetical protein